MFSLMGNCAAWAKSKKRTRLSVTILTVGLDNAGKTTTVQHQLKGDLSDIAPTVGFSMIDLHSGRFNVKILDLGGGERIREIWHNYMAETHGLIFVVDSSDLDRMDECRIILENLLSDERIKRKPVLILANKQDQPVALSENDICVRLNLEEIANRNECFCKLVLCSALPMKRSKLKKRKVDRGIKNGFTWLLDMIGNNFEKIQERVNNDVEKQKEREAQDRRERMERVQRIREERNRLENSGDKIDQRCDDHPNSPVLKDGVIGESKTDLDGELAQVKISQSKLTPDMSNIVREEVNEESADWFQDDSVRFADSPLPGSVQQEASDSEDGKNKITDTRMKNPTPSQSTPIHTPLGSNIDLGNEHFVAIANRRLSSAQSGGSPKQPTSIHTPLGSNVDLDNKHFVAVTDIRPSSAQSNGKENIVTENTVEHQTWATESGKKPRKKKKKKRQTNKVKPIGTESNVENNNEAFVDDGNVLYTPSVSPQPSVEMG